MSNVKDCWLKLLNPETLKNNLVKASIFIASFEIFKNSIMDHLKGFYSNGFSVDNKTNVDQLKYKENVLSLDSDPFIAACIWFKNETALSNDDINDIRNVRKHRNLLAHQMLEVLSQTDYDVDTTLFDTMLHLLAKIERWWILNIEIPTNPDYDNVDPTTIPDNEIQSGNMILLQVISCFLRNEEGELKKIYDQMKM